MIAAILSTGTELTRGELINTNATWLASELSQLDIEVTAIDTVDDHIERIAAAFRRLSLSHDLVICTGGLGPTTDDLTAKGLARAADVDLVVHEPSLHAIEARLARLGRQLTESNAKQAYLPRGGAAIDNPHGTAPGFTLTLNRACVHCLPGVPTEMKPMFTSSVAPTLVREDREHIVQVVLRTAGMAESSVNDSLGGIASKFGVTLGYRVHFPELAVKVIAHDRSAVLATEQAERAAAVVRERLGSRVVYGRDDDTLASVLTRALRTKRQRLAIAESCTGGHTSALLTSVPGVSEVFVGSVVAYANDVKQNLLGVPLAVLESYGAVSEPTAIAMAEGVRRRFDSDWGLAITGIAGPTGATADKPLGTVHFAVIGPGVSSHQHRVLRWDRARVQRLAAFLALNWLRCLLDDPKAELA